MKHILTLSVAALALAGCANPELATSGFVLPANKAGNTVVGGLTNTRENDFTLTRKNADDEDIVIAGYAYGIGRTETDTGLDIYRGQAGIFIETVVIAPPAAGIAEWTGTYGGIHVYDISSNNDHVVGSEVSFGQHIVLTADFGAGTLSGSTSDLTIAGTFDDKHLGGTVTHDGLVADLDGMIGADIVVGAFHGTDADELVVGGFAGYK